MTDLSRRTPSSDLLITETVRIIEEKQPLVDSEAMQRAFERRTGREERLLERGKILGSQLQLQSELQHWKTLLRYTGLALGIFALLFGAGIAASVTAQNRTINAPYALLLALGPHLFALLLWFFTLWRSDLSAGSSIGGTLLRGAARLPIRRGPHFWSVLDAANSLYARNRLLPWIAGIASHSFWTVALLAVLFALGISFSFQAYRLTWETTILPADFFVGFVRLSGWLPHQLGFPLPDAVTLLDPSSPDSDHRTWAWWLIGCITVYGLLPRVLLAAISWAIWHARRRRMTLDLSHPYFAKLLARFNEMEPSAITDHEKKQTRPHQPLTRVAVPGEKFSLAVIGFELPDEVAWPPTLVPRHADMVERIMGSNQERRSLLEQLAQRRPYRLLFACNRASTPDRGTAHFLREAAAHAVQCAILLLPAATYDDAVTRERWTAWLGDIGMEEMKCFTQIDEVRMWTEDNDD